MDQASIEPVDVRIPRFAHPRGVRRDGVEDRENIRWRARDHAQNFRGRRLLLERLRQVTVPRLELLEQPHVLDRNHRLIGKGLQQLDLTLGEEPDSGSCNAQHADGSPLAEHGDNHLAAVAEEARSGPRHGRGIRLDLQVGDVHDLAAKDGQPGQALPTRWVRVAPVEPL